ncbi:hypothetical protein INQ51_00960 [Maribellus sp. CM-23]|uniref:hypothetical protein n=1 Tax=Maribellus sp. CM-23 TaxID=2781026 RepID=UPI001F38FC87|nr:hypothetical protein [Maribellus sp. CM-23]MCE4562865.1 hypothetical protein [Maribellus sp. CM-23]
MRIQLRIIITCLLIFAGVQIHAQITIQGFTLTTEANSTKYKLPGKQFYPLYVPSGSEFMDNKWQFGYVILENKDRYDSLRLKFNTYKNEIIWLHNRSMSMIELDKNVIKEFGFYSETGNLLSFQKLHPGDDPEDTHYFKMLYDGKLKIAILHYTIEKKVSAYRDKLGFMRNTSFEMRTDNYLIFPGNDFERFKFKRTSFLNLFGVKKKEVRRVLRQNQVRLSQEKDFIRAISVIEKELY